MSILRQWKPDQTLDAALVSGGDDRLKIDVHSGMNGYGCTPFPRPDQISLSSTTASTISAPAYNAAAATFGRLKPEDSGASGRYADAMEEIKAALKSSFGWVDEEIILSPSGTDSELLLLHLAQALFKQPPTSVLVSSDETGSGVWLAASGRHFSSRTSSGRLVGKGDPIDGLNGSIISINSRGEDGELLSTDAVDSIVHDRISTEIRSGRSVVLHVMHHSKTGARGPSEQCLTHLLAQFPLQLQIAVDACQGRASPEELRRFLGAGCIVLITGSKFFSGPPLSGALVLPPALAERFRRAPASSAELGDYSTRYDWPADWTIREALPDRVNIGQLLRWRAALTEIERYFAVPLAFRETALQSFETAVRRAFLRHNEVQLLDGEPEAPLRKTSQRNEFRFRSVFSFAANGEHGALQEPEARLLYRALNVDVSAVGPSPVAAQSCHIGQPVVIKSTAKCLGALRISASARLASESWAGISARSSLERLQENCAKVNTVLEKTSFLLERFELVRKFLEQSDRKSMQ